MPCKLCELEPVYKLLNNQKLCKFCYIKYFEKKVFKTIRRFKLFDIKDKLVIATSGGKDSITVLYLTHKYLSKKNLQDNVEALVIDEGIADYREHTIKFLEEFCAKHKIKLSIVSYKQKFKKTLDESVSILKTQKSNISACNICGTFRRQALNTAARDLGATKLVTGHNIDDEGQNILLNIFKNNFKILARLGPNNGIVSDNLFVPRVKPLYEVSEKEVRLYTLIKGFDVGYDECPYAKGSFRQNIGEMINKLEDEHKGVKNSLINFYLESQKVLQEKYTEDFGTKVTYCKLCGEPTQKEICNTCELIDKIK